MTDKLSLYNGALNALGARKLASLTESRESRRVLDGVWDRDWVRTALEQGYWKFAIRTDRVDYDPSITPDFGYRRAFAKPDDFLRTAAISADEYFTAPLIGFEDEATYWYADLDEIYVRYTSSDEDYGLNYAAWPANFTRYVETWGAIQACERLTQGAGKKQALELDAARLLARAKSTDALDGPPRFFPRGSWSRARGGNGGGDRGNRGSLIG